MAGAINFQLQLLTVLILTFKEQQKPVAWHLIIYPNKIYLLCLFYFTIHLLYTYDPYFCHFYAKTNHSSILFYDYSSVAFHLIL
jgi:hypothetical protein